MAKPKSLDEFFVRKAKARGILKAFVNAHLVELAGLELNLVTQADLETWGLKTDEAKNEINKISYFKNARKGLDDFNKSV